MNLQHFFSVIIQSTIYGSIVGIIILLLKLTITRKLSAKWQYTIWFVMILKMIFPVGPQSSISIFNRLNINNAVLYLHNNQLNHAKLFTVLEKAEKAVDGFSFLTLFPHIWISVSVCFLLSMLIIWNILSHKIRSTSKVATDNTINILNKCKLKLGIKKQINVVVQKHILFPSLFGIINPKILVTEDMENMKNDNLEYIFLHELSHYKRGDNIINCLLIIIQCLHWFNPIIWYIFNKHIKKDMELATDECTMIHLKDCEYKNYGNTLIETLEYQSKKVSIGLLGLNGNDKNDIALRLKAIRKFSKPKFHKTLSGILYIFVMSVVCLTSSVVAKPLTEKIQRSIISTEENSSTNTYVIVSENKTVDYINTNNQNKINSQQYITETITEINTQENDLFSQGTSAFLYYNTDDTNTQTTQVTTGKNGHIVFYFENNTAEHPIKFNISKPENKGNGWDFMTNANNGTTFNYSELQQNTTYAVTIDTHCPGKYGIKGKILIKGE